VERPKSSSIVIARNILGSSDRHEVKEDWQLWYLMKETADAQGRMPAKGLSERKCAPISQLRQLRE